MKIAYLILAHDTPNHLPRLVRALDSENATFFVHVDRKFDIVPFRAKLRQPNVVFLDDRVAVYWGEFSQVEAIIRLVKAALSRAGEVAYLCLLSGCDYPLRRSRYIEEFFSRNRGLEFINCVPIPNPSLSKPMSRVEGYRLQNRWNVKAFKRLTDHVNEKLRFIKRDYRRVFGSLEPYAGSTWWALSLDACWYVLEFAVSRPEVVKFFRNVPNPDESFFQTVLGNSPYTRKMRRNLTFTDWSRTMTSPGLINMEHLESFSSTYRLWADDGYGQGELLFARKFPDDSAALTEFVDTRIVNR